MVGQAAPTRQAEAAAAAQEWQRREMEAVDTAAREGQRALYRGGQPVAGVGA